MAKRRQGRKKARQAQQKLVRLGVPTGLAAILILLGALLFGESGWLSFGLNDAIQAVEDLYDSVSTGSSLPADSGELEVHMIDVGQGLSVFVRAPGGDCALIDAGDRDDGETVSAYLQNLGVNRIDVLIATHPHADHIGGMTQVVKDIDIGRVVMTDLPESMQPTSKVYTDLLQALIDRGNKITVAEPNMRFYLGNATLTLVGPVEMHSDLNDTSIVSRITYGDRAFLVPGDAEEPAEISMLDQGQMLKADVLIAGHHGSSTSSSMDFLRAVKPMYVGISCGIDNSYGHPHPELLERLDTIGCAILRTDLQGDVVFYTDGENIRVDASKAA